MTQLPADAGAEQWAATSQRNHRRRERTHWILVWAWRAGLAIVVFGGWEYASRVGIVDPFFASRPTRVIDWFSEAMRSAEFWGDMWVTIQEAMISFLIASVAAVSFGFLVAQNRMLRDVIRPILTLLNSTPRVAFAPLLIVWLGLGMASKIALGISLVFFVVLNGTMVGAKSVDRDLLVLARQLGISSTETFRKVTLPSSIPSIFGSLDLGLVYAFLGVVVAEMLSAPQGIGQYIQYHAGILRMEAVLGAIAVLSLLVAAMVYGLQRLESFLLRWHVEENHER